MAEIKLVSGKIVLVDDSDYEYINSFRWYWDYGRHTTYAKTKINGKWIKMHRLILGLTNEAVFADHKDKNGLNNCRENLRICRSSDNQRNKKGYGTSKYKGVSRWYNKWQAKINVTGKQKHLGLFENEIDAAKAYNKAAIESGNIFFTLNEI